MLQAYHSNPLLKFDVLQRLAAARDSGELSQGANMLWDETRFCGCAVGVLTRSNERPAYEERFGLPVALAWFTQEIFEALPEEIALEFPERLMQAIPVGADLTDIFWKMLFTTLKDLGYADSVDLTFDDLKIIDVRALNYDPKEAYDSPRRVANRVVQYAMLSGNGWGGSAMRDKRLNQSIWHMPMLPGGAPTMANRLIALVETPRAVAKPRRRGAPSFQAPGTVAIARSTGRSRTVPA